LTRKRQEKAKKKRKPEGLRSIFSLYIQYINPEGAIVPGSIKGDVKKKHFSLFPGRFFSDIQPPSRRCCRFGSRGQIGLRFIWGCIVPCDLFAPASSGLAVANHGSI
jgi:hypothetical protein